MKSEVKTLKILMGRGGQKQWLEKEKYSVCLTGTEITICSTRLFLFSYL